MKSFRARASQIHFFGLPLDGIIALISGFVSMLQLGTIYTMGTFIPYLASYLHYYENPQINTSNLSLLQMFTMVGINVGMIGGSYLPSKLSSKLILSFSMFGLVGFMMLCSFLKTRLEFLLIYGLGCGIFIGLGYLHPITNCYSYLPNKKGLCAGVCIMGFGLSSVIFNQVFQAVINPNNISVDQNKYYPIDVADNVPYSLIITAIIYGCFAIVGILLFWQKPKQTNSIVIAQNAQKIDHDQKITFKYLINRKIHMIVINVLLAVPFGYFIAVSYKEYGQYYFKNDNFLTLTGTLGSVGNGICRSIWGTLFDKLSWKQVSVMINVTLLICSILINFITFSEVLYCMIVFVTYFCYGGLYSICPTQTFRIVGAKNGSVLYPYVFLSFSFGAIIEYVAHEIVIVNMKLQKQGFFYCFMTFGGCQLISLVLAIFVNYQYHSSQRKQGMPAKQKLISSESGSLIIE